MRRIVAKFKARDFMSCPAVGNDKKKNERQKSEKHDHLKTGCSNLQLLSTIQASEIISTENSDGDQTNRSKSVRFHSQ
jgi:hypothetical protein